MLIHSARRGVSRVDFLVMVSVLVLGTALLTKGVHGAREGAVRLKCQQNLQRMGVGFTAFADAHQGFPARRLGLGDRPKGGWGALLLPHIGEETLAKKFSFDFDYFDPANKAVVETQVATFQCPAAATRKVTIKSNATATSLNPNKDTVFEVKAGSTDYIASNGFGMPATGYGFNWSNSVGGNGHQAMEDDRYLPLNKITDGLSTTLLIVEQAGRPEAWRLGKKSGDSDQFAMSNLARGTWAGFGSIAFRPTDSSDGFTFDTNRGDAMSCTVNCNNTVGIYGFHKGGAWILFCDGSVRFVSNMSGLTFGQITTRDDGQLVDPDDF